MRHLSSNPSGKVVLSDLDQLKDLNIFIYGSGSAGTKLKQKLEADSRQFRVSAFLDSFENGQHEGLEKIIIDDYVHQPGNMIVIASTFYREISNKLANINIHDFFIDPQFDCLYDEKEAMNGHDYENNILNLQDINKLKDCTIYLYGAGGAGSSFKKLMEEDYPDIRIAGFLDSYKSGVFEGLEVLTFDDYEHLGGNIIIVTSYGQKGICDTLTKRGINDYYIADSFWMFSFMFRPSEHKEKEEDINKISRILFTEKDKKLYNLLFEARSYNSGLASSRYLEESGTTVMALNDPVGFKKDYFEHTNKQYLDFVKTEFIESVVQAGVYDGSDILEINALAPHLKIVYGFEPLGTQYLLPQIHDMIEDKKVIIEQYALYDKRATINFFPFKAGSYVSDSMTPVNGTFAIETISLDDYCEINRIDHIDFICCDIEDAEIQFLIGAKKIIRKSRPQLAISIYHSKKQFVEIPLLLDSMLDNYIFRIGHYSDTLNETTIYAIPNELGSP